MKCQEKDCNGVVNVEISIPMRTSCHSFSEGFACSVCGRMYWKDGTPITNRPGNDCFLESGDIIHKDAGRKEVSRAEVGV